MSAAKTADEKEPVYSDGPYSIKWMSAADKLLIWHARRRAGLDAGEWIGRAVRMAVAAERADAMRREGVGPGEIEDGPTGGHTTSSVRMIDLSLDDLAKAWELGKAMGAHTKSGQPPRDIGGAIKDRLAAMLRGRDVTLPPEGRRVLLEAPSETPEG
jgi:hypothetical protein